MAAEAVVVLVHPLEQTRRCLVGVRVLGLSRLDPAAVELIDELTEEAARVVELLDLQVARGEEGLVQGGGPGGIAGDELGDLGRDLVEVAHEREAGTVGDEGARVQRQLDLLLDRIALASDLSSHRSLRVPASDPTVRAGRLPEDSS